MANSKSSIEGFPAWLEYATVYKLIHLESIASTESWDISHAIILIMTTIVLLVVSVWFFQKRDVNV